MVARPELAVVVVGFRAPPDLIGAIRSVVEQSVPLEIVVVNTGGGGASALLSDAGLDVKVIEAEERLFAGGARNLGIAATQAPFIAFLADDCLACPGWAEARLRRHHEGAASVASAILNSHPRSLVACAAHLVLHMRRLPGLPSEKAQRYGASFDRRLFDRFGLFDGRQRSGEDTEFIARLPDSMKPVWEPLVLTVHRNETRLLPMLADQYARGRRYGAYLRRVGGGKPSRPFRKVFRDRRNVIRLAKEGMRGTDRLFVMLSMPIVWMALLCKSAGASIGAANGEAEDDDHR